MFSERLYNGSGLLKIYSDLFAASVQLYSAASKICYLTISSAFSFHILYCKKSLSVCKSIKYALVVQPEFVSVKLHDTHKMLSSVFLGKEECLFFPLENKYA